MRLSTLAAIVLSLTALAAVGCHREAPPPPPPPPAAPVSIWSAADSQAVAAQFVDAAARDAWCSQFRDRVGRSAKIAVGEILDRSGKDIPVDGLVAALDAALKGSDKLAVAPAAEADYTLKGKLGATPAKEDGAEVTYFQIDLLLVDAKSGDPAWPFAVERRIGR